MEEMKRRKKLMKKENYQNILKWAKEHEKEVIFIAVGAAVLTSIIAGYKIHNSIFEKGIDRALSCLGKVNMEFYNATGKKIDVLSLIGENGRIFMETMYPDMLGKGRSVTKVSMIILDRITRNSLGSQIGKQAVETFLNGIHS